VGALYLRFAGAMEGPCTKCRDQGCSQCRARGSRVRFFLMVAAVLAASSTVLTQANRMLSSREDAARSRDSARISTLEVVVITSAAHPSVASLSGTGRAPIAGCLLRASNGPRGTSSSSSASAMLGARTSVGWHGHRSGRHCSFEYEPGVFLSSASSQIHVYHSKTETKTGSGA